MEKKKAKFKRVILNPILSNPIFNENGWMCLQDLIQNLVNNKFRYTFFKKYAGTLETLKSEPSNTDKSEFIDNLLLIYSLPVSNLRDNFNEIRKYLIENLIILKDEEVGKTFSRRFYHKFKDYDIWL